MDDIHYRIERQKEAIRALLTIAPSNRRTGILHSLRMDAVNRLQSDPDLTAEDPEDRERSIENFYEKCDLFSVTEAGLRLKARRKNWLLVWWSCTFVLSAQVFLSPFPVFHWMNHGSWQAVVLPLISATYLTVWIGVVWDNRQGKKLKREDIDLMKSHRPELPHIIVHAVDELLEEHYQS